MATEANKLKWIEVFRKAGLDDAGMHRWHLAFEKHWPDGHQRFLEWLDLAPPEIVQIRTDSQSAPRL
jgi:hypothetical protein